MDPYGNPLQYTQPPMQQYHQYNPPMQQYQYNPQMSQGQQGQQGQMMQVAPSTQFGQPPQVPQQPFHQFGNPPQVPFQQIPVNYANTSAPQGPQRGQPPRDRMTATGRIAFADDDKRLPRKYRQLGGVHLIDDGMNRVTPKRFRASLVSSCDNKIYPMVRVGMLDEEHTDLLAFCVLGLRPDLQLKFLAGPQDTMGKIRDDVVDLYQHKMQRNASRMSPLSEEWDNIPALSLRMGFPRELLTERLSAAFETYQSARDMTLAKMSSQIMNAGPGHEAPPRHVARAAASGLKMLANHPSNEEDYEVHVPPRAAVARDQTPPRQAALASSPPSVSANLDALAPEVTSTNIICIRVFICY